MEVGGKGGGRLSQGAKWEGVRVHGGKGGGCRGLEGEESTYFW